MMKGFSFESLTVALQNLVLRRILKLYLNASRKDALGLGEGIDREFGIDMYTLLYLKWITNKDLLYNTGNSAQYYVTT